MTEEIERIVFFDPEVALPQAVATLSQIDKFTVTQFLDDNDGIEQASAMMPKIILIAVNLPLKDSIGLLETASQNEQLQSVPVVLIAKNIPEAADIDKAKSLGAVSVIEYSADVGKLFRQIDGAWRDFQFAKQMKVFQQEYLAGLVNRIADLEKFKGRANIEKDGDRWVLFNMAHKLAGGGKTFGFAAITDAAKIVENQVHIGDSANLDRNISTLIETMRNIFEDEHKNH